MHGKPLGAARGCSSDLPPEICSFLFYSFPFSSLKGKLFREGLTWSSGSAQTLHSPTAIQSQSSNTQWGGGGGGGLRLDVNHSPLALCRAHPHPSAGRVLAPGTQGKSPQVAVGAPTSLGLGSPVGTPLHLPGQRPRVSLPAVLPSMYGRQRAPPPRPCRILLPCMGRAGPGGAGRGVRHRPDPSPRLGPCRRPGAQSSAVGSAAAPFRPR